MPRYRAAQSSFLVFLAMLALPGLCRGQDSFQPGGMLRIEGDSSLHKWSSTATAVSLTFKFADDASPILAEAIKAAKIDGLEVSVPVAGLKSGESGLDKNLRKAMNEKEFPLVVFRLDRYETAKGAADGILSVKAAGRLSIAGKTKSVTIDAELRPSEAGIELKGSYALKMSDYGVAPPTLMMGAIKTRDPVTIAFDLLLKARQKDAVP